MGFCNETAGIWKILGEVVFVIRIVIPIIIILLGTLDLGKAVLAGEEKTIKEAQKAFIRRLIYGVAIFFVVPLVKAAFGLVGFDVKQNEVNVCWVCSTRPHSKECASYAENASNSFNNDNGSSSSESSNNFDNSNDEIDDL